MNISRPHTSRFTRLVRPVLASVRGVVDLASIMVGGIVLGVIAAGALVTVFGVIPWTQDNAAKQDLATVTSAQAVAYAKDGHYLDVDGLVEAGYLSGAEAQAAGLTTPGGHGAGVFAAGASDAGHPMTSGELRIQVGLDSSCYIAASASGSGAKFVTSSRSQDLTRYGHSTTYDCAGTDVKVLVGEVSTAIITDSLADPATGVAYTDTVYAVGTGTITYNAEGLPEGLTINSDTGEITGQATSVGDYTVTITAHSDSGDAERDYTMSVWDAPTITTTSLPDGTAGDSYTATIEATGTDPIHYSTGVSGLPTGLSLNADTGKITGTPADDGDFQVTIVATNGGGTDSHTLTMRVATAPKMVSTWDTNLISGPYIRIPVVGFGKDITIDWGDGETTHSTSSLTERHFYDEDGKYTITVYGHFSGWKGNNDWSTDALTGVTEWHGTGTTQLNKAFKDAVNLTHVDEIPDDVKSLDYMFDGATAFNQDISDWDVSSVTNMSYMFHGAAAFNQDISGWDVSNVSNMTSMFRGATAFNQDISGWDVSNVGRNEHPYFATSSGLVSEHIPAKFR